MSNPQEDPNADLDGHLSDTHNALLAAAETQGPNDSAEVTDFMEAFGSSIHNVLDAPAQEAQEPANNVDNFDLQNAETANTAPEASSAEGSLDPRLAS